MSGFEEDSNKAFRADTEADIRKTESDNDIATTLIFDLPLIFAAHVWIARAVGSLLMTSAVSRFLP